MFEHHVLAQDERQELVVGDVLDDGRHDVPRLLEDHIVLPVLIDVAQLPGDPVVLPHHEQVDDGQHGLLIRPRVPSQETVDILRYQWSD